MGKTAFHYKESTGEIIGKIQVSRDSDLILNKKQGIAMVEIANAHRALGKEHEYEIKSGKIKKKPQQVIDKEAEGKADAEDQRRMPEFLKTDEDIKDEIFIDFINEVRQKAGMPGKIKKKDLYDALVSRRELHRNPNKR